METSHHSDADDFQKVFLCFLTLEDFRFFRMYEFLALRWFDFFNGETEDEACQAELWLKPGWNPALYQIRTPVSSSLEHGVLPTKKIPNQTELFKTE
ncbi:hypothetical protein YC2023_060524 [Brassica napus]